MTHGLMPWTGFGNLKQDMARLFDRLVASTWDDFPTLGDWAPSMDISETKDSLVVKVEVPGMDQKDIRIALQENLLTITGEKTQEKEANDERYHRVERSYGAFTRGVRLPVAVDGSRVAATFK
ncbi:MAG: Hsp20/alpha crystallin family protein, partial [Candidatus Rokuibacteriota bacterium]